MQYKQKFNREKDVDIVPRETTLSHASVTSISVTNVQSQKYISRVLTSEFVLSQVVVTVTRTSIVKRGPHKDTAAPAVTSNT